MEETLNILRKNFKKRAIMKELSRGPKSPALLEHVLCDNTGKRLMTRDAAWHQLKVLRKRGLVQNNDKGIYDLTHWGRRVCEQEGI